MKNKFPIILLIACISILVVFAAAIFVLNSKKDDNSDNTSDSTKITPSIQTTQNPNESGSTITTDEDNSQSGDYIEYSLQNLTDEKNVIFFAASWCPTCKALDKAINEDLDSIPSDLTILKADYDKETELKKKYGVTYQHTLVQVDKEGSQIDKWSGSYSIEEIIEELN